MSPKKGTVIELVIGRFPLPYGASCLLVVLLWTSVYSVAIGLSKGLDLASSLLEWTFLLASPGYASFLFFIFYVFYSPQYVRAKLLQSKNPISTLLPSGEADFNKIFGRVSALRPALIVWVLLFVGLNLSFFSRTLAQTTLPLTLFVITVGNVAILGLLTLGMSSLIWAYTSSLRGITSMGKMHLRLQPYHRDRHLGLRPVGSLALSLVIVYLAFVAILVTAVILGGPTPIAYAVVFLLLVLGLLSFFLPLVTLHRRMVEQKEIDRDRLEEKSTPVFEAPLETFSLDDLSRAFLVDMRRKEITSVAAWPFDTSILAKLTVIVLSVVAALVARYIATLLRI